MKSSLHAALRLPTLLLTIVVCAPVIWAQEGDTPAAITPELSVSSKPSAITNLDADTEARCFAEAVSLSGDTAWCDVLITTLNAQQPPKPETTAALVRGYLNRALLLTKQGELELAEADLLAAIRLQPTAAHLYLALGNLRLNQRRFNEALERYNDAIERSVAPPPGYFINRALALRGLGQIQLAAADVARAQAMPAETMNPEEAISPSDTVAAPEVGFQ